MLRKLMVSVGVILLISLPTAALAEHHMWGLLQTWYSCSAFDSTAIGDEVSGEYTKATQSGFGLRRGYLGLSHADGPFSSSLLVNVGSGGVALIDLWIDLAIGERLSLRGGHFAAAGMRVAGLQSSGRLDLVERPIIAAAWMGALERGGGRTNGLQLSFKPNRSIQADLSLHNSSDDIKRSLTQSGEPVSDTGLAPLIDFGITARPSPAMEFGLSYGQPGEKRMTTGNMTAHAYYENDRLFTRFDYAMLMYNPEWSDDGKDYTGMGFSFTGGYKIGDKLQIVGRFEQWDPDTNLDLGSAEPGYFHQDITTVTPADSAWMWNPDAGGGVGANEWQEVSPEVATTETVRSGLVHDYTYRRNVSLGLNYSFRGESRYDQRLQFTYTRRLDETASDRKLPDSNIFQAVWQVSIH